MTLVLCEFLKYRFPEIGENGYVAEPERLINRCQSIVILTMFILSGFTCQMFPRHLLSLSRSSRYLTFAKSMSSTAYIFPFDHHSSSSTQITDISKLWSLTPQGEKLPKVGTTRIFYDTPPSKVTTISSLGEGFASKKSEVKRELVRKSVGSAVKELKAYDGLKEVLIDASADPHAAGVFLFLIQPYS